MDKISSPSKWAKEWTKDSKQKNGSLFRNHRPTNASDIPIQFYHRIFETFINFARIAKYQRGNVNMYGGGHKYASNCFNFQGEIITENVNDQLYSNFIQKSFQELFYDSYIF